ncbi:MAG: Lrp/AsnC family transcriptional regulator [Candidatus Bathyarchaeia archaeon]
MDEIDLKLLAGMEKGITLTTAPFNDIALELGITPKEVVTRLCSLKEKCVIRRFGASLKPNSIGFSANALVAWKVPENRVQEIGTYLSKYQEISHCYERQTVNRRWDYNLYTVIHGRERAVVQSIVKEISEVTAISEYKILYSTKDLKRNVSVGNFAVLPEKAPSMLCENFQELNDP